ncbi:response regulator [uncultured Oceanisphaera sp.]|uniref:response regulator n=1 Tax=uncultured Oceanisphaera sp. TaxID=353858 RepID=UPI00260C478A|nr:response regulator [uncultured Oceanisphaera sp.]
MMSVAKRRNLPVPRWTILTCALLLCLLFIAYGSNQYRQYRYYQVLQQQTEPVLKALHRQQSQATTSAKSGLQLNEQLTSLALTVSHFIRFIEQHPIPLAGTDEVFAELNRYQETVLALQDADIRSRHALQSFAEALQGLPTRPEYEQFLQHSRLYLTVPNQRFLYALDDEAERLRQAATGEWLDAFYYHRLYRHRVGEVIRLREAMAANDLSALLQRTDDWRQQAEDSWKQMRAILALLVLLFVGLGVLLLVVRNRQLREASQASFALARAKTDFLANMSHEIRTPMNAIIGFASLLQQTPLNGQQSEYLKKIKNSSDNLLLLINDILDLTKVEAGKLELEDIEFDLNELLERLSGLFADMSEQKQLEVIINKVADVPDCLHGDPLRLGQVLVNLVNNAVKFTERGEVVLTVSVCADPEPRLCIEVSDTGIGIMPDQLNRLFGSFTQVDASTTRKYGGSGLGLSISRHLVQLMGGTIEVSSQPGRGSIFTVKMPLQPATMVRAELQPAHLAGQKVLLVDDNALVLEVMSRLLRGLGLVVYSAQDVGTARELLHKRGFELNLALIDCCLGQDNGLELARYLVQQPHFGHIGVVIMSAFGRERPEPRMQALGIEHYLSKPVTEHSLIQCLNQVLGNDADAAGSKLVAGLQDLAFYHGQLAGKQILLAEDNRMNQQLIVEFLKQVSVSVTLADNGRQAVEQMVRRRFDAILMDLQMPILDGLEATRQIRKLRVHHDIPIVALTASAMRGDREASLEAGMNGYVTKPVNRLDLYQALTQILAHSPAAAASVADRNTDSAETTNAESKSAADNAAADAEHADAWDTQPRTTAVSSEGAGPSFDTATDAATELLARQRADFAAQHQDDVWLLQAALAGEDWSEALAVVTALAEQAEACGLAPLAAQARALRLPLQQRRRPEPEQLTALSHALGRLADEPVTS